MRAATTSRILLLFLAVTCGCTGASGDDSDGSQQPHHRLSTNNDAGIGDAASPLAQITYPVNGNTSADLTLPIQWSSVAGAQSYYLYVGTTLGAKNVVDTGEISQTSYLATSAPIGVTLYARIWTKLGGAWASSDSTFTAAEVAAQQLATITYPAAGATNADLTQPITWTAGTNAQKYYLYIGSRHSARSDLVDSGELTGALVSNVRTPHAHDALRADVDECRGRLAIGG